MTALRLDSITEADAAARRRVLICGSHGGRIAGHLASAAGVRAAIFSDAGGGLHGAGFAGIRALEAVGMAAATVAAASARIGDAQDMAARGVISAANRTAEALGVAPGMTCAEAAARLDAAAGPEGVLPTLPETRRERRIGGRPVLLADSVSLVRREDRGRIVVTGSHGGLIGGDPKRGLAADVAFAAFNDAAIGIDGAGLSRLPTLEPPGIAAVAVSHASARIGEAESTLDGMITAANLPARRRGFELGARLRPALEALR
ncbi:MAG: hypothetical protein R6V44_11850 [Paracoccaceae bacterium]